VVRKTASAENLSAKGAYVLADAEDFQATIFATGTEVGVAMKAREILAGEGVAARVVSVPSFEKFAEQPAAYQAQVLGRGKARVAVEAAVQQGWERFIGEDGGFVGMTGFGASAPAEQLYDSFGITAEKVAQAVRARV
jgi:transketolase